MSAHEMDIEGAMDTITRALTGFEQLHQMDRTALLRQLDAIQALADQAKKIQTRLQYAERDRRNSTAASRKAVRDKLIPEWCIANLKPGMVVKVETASSTKFREVVSVGKTSFRGNHCKYVLRRASVNEPYKHELSQGMYITDHVLTNIQAVVTGYDSKGRVVVTPIMELIEKE